MNQMTTIKPDAQGADAVSPRSMLGECIFALNSAARQIERLGGDSSIQRETVERATPVRWTA